MAAQDEGRSQDVVSVAGFLSNTGNGTVTVNNAGPALSVGDRFVLFSQPVTGGPTGSGERW